MLNCSNFVVFQGFASSIDKLVSSQKSALGSAAHTWAGKDLERSRSRI